MGRNEKHRVVISGIAGRFPNSSNVAEFQKNLLNKVDCTTTEHGRWNIGIQFFIWFYIEKPF